MVMTVMTAINPFGGSGSSATGTTIWSPDVKLIRTTSAPKMAGFIVTSPMSTRRRAGSPGS